jgi:hypothetical protein
MKAFVKGLFIGGALLSMVGAANAEVNINIYGASAQYKFWNAAADDFLTAQGCTGVQQAVDSAKNGITRGTCAGETVYIRYSSKASFDGIRAMQGIDPDGVTSCSDKHYREMADETQTDWTAGTVSGTKCVDVNIGASDVAAGTFKQTTTGNLDGHFGGTRVTRTMTGATIYDDGLTAHRPVVVPFAFFANDSVPFTNMSRVMATSLFSGQIGNWQDLDPDVASQEVVLCMRHAGSGTHATLDANVMRGDAALLTTQPPFGNTNPTRWFYEGSSDLVAAVAALAGSVGYADADKGIAAGGFRMTYNGEEPIRKNIVNGKYSFWSAQWLYEDPDEPGQPTIGTWIQDLVDFASDPDNLVIVGKDGYWAAQGELQMNKANDFAWPLHN